MWGAAARSHHVPWPGGPWGPQKLPAHLSTPHPVFTAPRAHPGLRQPHPSPPTAEVRQDKSLGTGGSRKDPPRRPCPMPGVDQAPRAALEQCCLSPPLPVPRAPQGTHVHSRCLAPRWLQASRAPHARSPSTQRGQANTVWATSTRTEHCAGAGSAARQTSRSLPTPFTTLGLRRSRAHGCSASAASRVQGWLEEVSHPHVPQHCHPQSCTRGRNPQAAAAHERGQPMTAAPTQQALGCPAQISVWRMPPRAPLAATCTCSSEGG